MSDYMSFLNSAELGKNREILTSFDWHLKFTKLPTVVASAVPTELEFNLRSKSVELPAEPSDLTSETEMRGFKVLNVGMVPNSGTLSITLQDFVDLEVTNFLMEYAYAANAPITRKSYRKEDLTCDIEFFRLNSQRERVRTLYCKGCLPTSVETGNQQGSTKEAIQECKIDFAVALYYWSNTVSLSNVPIISKLENLLG